jgi:signal transduction histidine kinase
MAFDVKEMEFGKAHRLAQSNYFPRIVGFAASFVLVSLLVITKDWSHWYFFYMSLYFLIYPHLVLLIAKAFPEQKVVEIRAMMVDAFILGIWTAYIHFSLWVSFAFLAATVLNHIMVGGRVQLLKGMGLYLLGILVGGTMTNFSVDLEAAFHIEILAMTALLGYIYSSAGIFYKQTRRLAEIRVELEEKNNLLNETIQKLETTRNELVEKAHKAGMADLATGVLHNIGNILNSVNTSSDVIHETIHRSKINNFKKANQLLKDKKDNFEDFLLNDPRGKDLIQYYLKLEEPLDREYEKIKEQAKRLKDKVNLISEVIEAQQDYAKVGRVNEKISLKEVTKDALKLQAGSIDRHNINVQEDYNDTVEIHIQKSKFIHILINLFKNAKEAMEGRAPAEKELLIRTWEDSEKVHLSITDNGEGIKTEHLNNVFNHGFTTKKEGHGFGLHTCANYMTEMGGEIKAQSEGEGKGTTFTVSFPREM